MSEHEADLLAQNRSAPSGLPGTALAVARAPKATAPLEESSCEPDAVCNALDEFLTRCRAGEDLDPDSFCDEHPSIKSSLRKVLTVQRVFEANDDLLASPEEDKWPHAGQVFLGLELRRFLGQGAFARVFLATEEALGGRRVAVKLSYGGGNEARTLGRLEHPNIVPVHSVREEKRTGLTAVVMPYLGSATLHNVLDRVLARGGPPQRSREILEAVWLRGQSSEVRSQKSDGGFSSPTSDLCPLTSDRVDPLLRGGTYVEGVVHLAAQLADALEYAHGQGVFHLDLKPSNVLLTPSGRPMLLDFNLAKDRECRGQLLGGTLPYMAPEQLRATATRASPERQRREEPDLDGCADVFALGVLLYELLAGQHPFGPVSLKDPEDQVRALLLARQAEGARPLHEVNARVGKRLSHLVHRCLETDPARRPASAGELAAGLRETQTSRLGGWVVRWLGSWVVAAALALAGALSFLGGDASPTTQPPHHPTTQRDLEQGLQALGEQRYQQAATHLRRALETDPDNPSAHFALGRALDKLGEIPEAQAHLKEAERGAPSGKVYAYLGYAYSRGIHREPVKAVYYYRKALAADYRTAIVYNNLGLIYSQGPRSISFPKRCALAEGCLNQAITLDRGLLGAYRTRMALEVNRAHQDSSYLPLLGVADVEHALKEGAAPLDYQRAAFLYATAVERAERRFLGGWVVRWLGGWGSASTTLPANHPTTQLANYLSTQPPNHPTTQAMAALGGWALVAGHVVAAGQPRPGQQEILLDLLARPSHYRNQARQYIKRANAEGIDRGQFRLDVYTRLVPLEELKKCESAYPPYREPVFDPLDGD